MQRWNNHGNGNFHCNSPKKTKQFFWCIIIYKITIQLGKKSYEFDKQGTHQ